MEKNCTNPDCEYGWITRKYIDVKTVTLRTGETRTIETEYEGATPCPSCDPTRAEIFATANNSNELHESLANRATHKRLQAYVKAEDDKTKVL